MNEKITYSIHLRLKDGSVIEGTLTSHSEASSCWLNLTAEGINESASGSDYFASFSKIRRRLAGQSIFPLCYGASKDIWPSGMARDMGQGLKAYRLVLGQPARELFEIFEAGEDINPVHPDEQEAFAKKWFESLKGESNNCVQWTRFPRH
jgi:hypothetical protein